MKSSSIRLLPALAILALAACAPDGDRPPDADATRVAGELAVEEAPPACTPEAASLAGPGSTSVGETGTIEVARTPYLCVGVVAGDTLQELDRVVTPFLMPDGRLVVPLAGASAIRVFSPEGEFLTSYGGPGAGPGEFRDLSSAWPRGDTIEAHDFILQRITRFLPNGSVAVVSLEPPVRGAMAVPGPLPDGWMVAGIASQSDSGRDQMILHRFGADGAYLGEIGEVGGMVRYRAPTFSGPGPLSPRAVFGLKRGEVYLADTLEPRIQVLDPSGSLQRELVWMPGESLSANAAFRLVLDSAGAGATPDRAAATRQAIQAFPVPDRLSAFWNFIVDEEAFVWVRPYDPVRHSFALRGPGAESGGRWLIISPDGGDVGWITLPDDLEPVQITSDAVVGIRRDALGVESVQVYTLRRR